MGKLSKPHLAPDPAMIMASASEGAAQARQNTPPPYGPSDRPSNYRPADPYPHVIPFMIGMTLFD